MQNKNEQLEQVEVPRKQEILTGLFGRALHEEIESCRDKGYDVQIGDTPDAAYEHPDKVLSVYQDLHDSGVAYASELKGQFLGSGAVHSMLESAVLKGRFGGIKAKFRQNKRDLKEKYLYGREDVQAMPWHDQGGKALALQSIMDAHELRPAGSHEGLYETASGRIDKDVLDYVFGDEAFGWLKGRTVFEAVVQTKQEYRGMDAEAAKKSAEKELQKLSEFVHQPVQAGFKDIVENCVDGLGIRSRKGEVEQAIGSHLEATDKEDILMMSVGCGTATAMLEALKRARETGKNAQLILLDQDPIALAAAATVAEKMGMREYLEIHCRQLFLGTGKNTHLTRLSEVLNGRKLDVCEDSGLREYFPNFLYKDLAQQAWESLSGGGLMTTANMNKNRAQPEFLRGLMGWPLEVKMRSVEDVARLHESVGIAKQHWSLRITQEGTYTLCIAKKPIE